MTPLRNPARIAASTIFLKIIEFTHQNDCLVSSSFRITPSSEETSFELVAGKGECVPRVVRSVVRGLHLREPNAVEQ